MSSPLTESGLRRLFKERVGYPLSASALRVAANQGDIADYQAGELSVDALMEALEEYSEILADALPDRGTQAGHEPEDFRRWAVMEILAREASADQTVAAFRRSHLPKGTLNPAAVEGWIKETAEADGEPTAWVTQPTGPDLPAAPDRLPGYREYEETVSYIAADSTHDLSIPIRLGGALDQLKDAATQVVRRTGWREAEAGTFVLTGLRPAATRVRWSIHRTRAQLLAFPLIHLEVAADATPNDIAAAYQKVRRRALGERPLPRAVNQKAAQLAVHAAQYQTGHTWADARLAWNTAHPEARYTNHAQFIRDSRQAYQRVIGRPLGWHGKQATTQQVQKEHR